MRTTLLFLLLGSALPGRSQSWCTPGAIWHYHFQNIGSVMGYERVAYIGDTLINGFSCQKLDRTLDAVDQYSGIPMHIDHPDLITRRMDNLVELRVEEEFDTLWHFGAVPGDQWRTPSSSGGLSGLLTVSDTGTLIMDEVPLRWWSVALSDLPWSGVQLDTIFERIGALHLFMSPGASFLMEDHSGPLRCYSDQEVSYVRSGVVDCEMLVGVDEHASGPSIRLYPQPTDGAVVLSWPDAPAGMILELRDAHGREMFREGGLRHGATLDLAALPTGTYVYALSDRSGIVHARGKVLLMK